MDNDPIRRMRKHYTDMAEMFAFGRFSANLKMCAYDSPIEEMFAAALLVLGCSPIKGEFVQKHFPGLLDAFGVDECKEVFICNGMDNPSVEVIQGLIVLLHPKIKNGSRVITPDFAMTYHLGGVDRGDAFQQVELSNKLAIELDGHDFHERTKEQATRDKSRDRTLLKFGWSTMRFTGSEVFRDPLTCACEGADLVHRAAAPNLNFTHFEPETFAV